MASRTSKKGTAAADEVPVSIPVFVPHHYLKIETRDGHMFVVDRNVAIMSRLIRSSLQELYRRALSEEDGGDSVRTIGSPTSAGGNGEGESETPRGSVRPSVLQEALLGGLGNGGNGTFGAEINEFDDERELGNKHAADSNPSSPNSIVLYALADGDVEVLANSERTAVAAGQLPIVYCFPSTTTAAVEAGQSSISGLMGSFAPQAPPSGKGGSKQHQQAQIAQEQAMFMQQQRAKVEEALDSMRDTPLTHIRLTKLTSEQFEIALRFMQYKYKVDHITDGPMRAGFRGFIPGQPTYPPPPSTGSALAPQQSTLGSPLNKRKSLAASSVLLTQSSMGGGGDSAALEDVDPITGAGPVRVPDPFTEHHVLLLAISSLLQL
jgi:hypothetical protein